MPRLERKMHENSRGVGGGEVLGGAAPSPSAILGERCKVLQRDRLKCCCFWIAHSIIHHGKDITIASVVTGAIGPTKSTATLLNGESINGIFPNGVLVTLPFTTVL